MNDERPIEKLLRRYAKKRRDAAGSSVELHPATRRLLQGEVARQLGAERRAPPNARRRFFNFEFLIFKSPRLAWAVPLFGLLAISAWFLLDRPATQQLALGPAPREKMAAEGSRASKDERREPASLPSPLAPRPSPVVEAAPAAVSVVQRRPPTDPVPIRSLSPPAPGAANQFVVGKNRDADQALAYIAATNHSVASLVGAAEQKDSPARYGGKEMVPVDKLGVASSAAPARARFAEASSANRASTLPADRPTETAAALQTDRSVTGVYAAKASELVAPLLDRPSASPSLARSDRDEREQTQTYSQSFANLLPESLKQKTAKAIAPPPTSPLLANFRVEQTGRQLRVVDSDGSTYVGETDVSPEFWGAVDARKEQAVQLFKSDGKLNQLPAPAMSVPESQWQNNSYRVAGTNRTLNQPVVFTWSFVELTNAPVTAPSGKIGGDRNNVAKNPPAPLPSSSISGRARFGTSAEIEIKAVPVPP